MIKIETIPTKEKLFGQSKWWGEPDMPEHLDYPELTLTDNDDGKYQDPLTFICQIRLEDIAALDPEGLLPHEGMIYFFAALDYFLGDLDTPAYPGMGMWQKPYFKVLYTPTCDRLHTHKLYYDDGLPATLPAESIHFSPCAPDYDDTRLLGRPYLEETQQAMPHSISLLQIDEDDRWNLVFHDCGMLNFLITPHALKKRQWDKVECYLHSF